MPDTVQFQPIKFGEEIPLVLNPHRDPDLPGRSLHYHDAVEVSLCTQGSGIFFMQDTVFPYREGALFQIAPNTLHAAHREQGKPASWLTLYLNIPYLAGIQSSEGIPIKSLLANQLIDTNDHPTLAMTLRTLSKEYYENELFSKTSMKGYFHILLVELARSSSKSGPLDIEHNPSLRSITPALNYIARNLDQPLPLSQLARSCSMSESHFRRSFLSITGISPHQYILDIRIQFARSLLNDRSISILEVSQRCGFETLSTFNRAFKKRTRMSPRDWRKIRNPTNA